MRTRCIILTSLLLIWLPVTIMAAEYQVKKDGTDDFTVIQAAIDVAVTGDVIVVDPGTYFENIRCNRRNIVLRSLDPEDKQIVATTVIDGQKKGSVISFSGTEDETFELSGLTITNGKSRYGGGLSGGGGTISNCTITGNSAGSGGGLWSCGGTIRSCTITGNFAAYGGGLFWCDGLITDCTITGNKAYGDEGAGGGLYACHGTISNCTITGNKADYSGADRAEFRGRHGTMTERTVSYDPWCPGCGGGLRDCDGTISNCTIAYNWAFSSGGGLVFCDGLITNCTVSHNLGQWSGGGLAECGGTIGNCTITGNRADFGAEVEYCNGMISNCIVWGNEAADEPDLAECDALVEYSCIRGWTGGGEGNISDDPLFVPGPLSDYYLSSSAAGQTSDSPCIDRGSGTAESLGLDKFTTRTDGGLDAGIVDMGCHYPLPDLGLWIGCSLNQDEFQPGQLLIASVEAENEGEEIVVDIYLGFMLPDGSALSYTGNFEWGLAA